MTISAKQQQRIWVVLFAIFVMVTSLATPTVAQEVTEPAPVEAIESAAETLVDAAVVTAEGAANTLEGVIARITTAPQSDIARVLLIIGGLVLLLAGWRIYDFIVVIAGFLIGATIAVGLVTTDSAIVTIAAFVIGGLIGAALAAFLYFVAVFLIGAYIGIALTNALAAALSLTPVSALALLVGGVIGGLILIGLSFEFLVLVSALVGAQMLTLGLGLDGLWTILFVIVGVVVQLGLMRAFRYNWRRPRRRWSLRRRV